MPRKKPAAPAATTQPIILPVPLKHWFMNESNPLHLRDVLEDPVLQLALVTTKDLALPTGAQLTGLDQHQLAVRTAYLAGMCDFIGVLRSLTTLPIDPVQESGWEYATNHTTTNPYV